MRYQYFCLEYLADMTGKKMNCAKHRTPSFFVLRFPRLVLLPSAKQAALPRPRPYMVKDGTPRHDLEMNFNKIAPSSRGLYSTLLIHAILVAISLLGGQCKSARFFPESTLLGRRRVARGRSVEKERRISFDDVSKSQLALLPRFGKEDTAKELQDHAADTQDTLVDAVENAEVAEIKRAVFRAL